MSLLLLVPLCQQPTNISVRATKLLFPVTRQAVNNASLVMNSLRENGCKGPKVRIRTQPYSRLADGGQRSSSSELVKGNTRSNKRIAGKAKRTSERLPSSGEQLLVPILRPRDLLHLPRRQTSYLVCRQSAPPYELCRLPALGSPDAQHTQHAQL